MKNDNLTKHGIADLIHDVKAYLRDLFLALLTPRSTVADYRPLSFRKQAW